MTVFQKDIFNFFKFFVCEMLRFPIFAVILPCNMADKSIRESYATGEPVAFLRIELKRGEFHLLPYGSLISAHLASESGSDNHDQLELVFASHDVTVTGFKLDEIALALQKTTCSVIRETNTASADFGDKPGIKSITVKKAGAKA